MLNEPLDPRVRMASPPVKDAIMVFLICDSRGKDLQTQFVNNYHRIIVKTYSGAKLYQATKLAENDIKNQQPDQVYVLAGINTITRLNRRTREVSLMSMEKRKIIQQYTDEMNFSSALLRRSTKAGTKIIFAPITGMDLAKYNRVDEGTMTESQNVLNEALTEINSLIIAQNAKYACKTPWTHGIVHRYFRKKYHFQYDRLDNDGCHLTEQVRLFWGRKIVSAINANI